LGEAYKLIFNGFHQLRSDVMPENRKALGGRWKQLYMFDHKRSLDFSPYLNKPYF
jgi:hypothetical protein